MSMDNWRFELRVRNHWGARWDSRQVRCALIPLAPAEQDGYVIPFDKLPGISIRLPAALQSARVLQLSVRHTGEVDDGATGELEIKSDDTGSTLRPFVIAGSRSAEEAASDARNLLDDAYAEDPTAGTPVGPQLPWALDHLYRSDELLNDAVKDGVRGLSWPLALAASSALVFDARLEGELNDTALHVQQGDNPPLSLPLTISPDVHGTAPEPDLRVLQADQYAHGFTFRLERDAPQRVFDGEHRVQIRRWAGAAPAGEPDLTDRRILPLLNETEAADAFHATDVLLPAEFAGEQLHYAIELINRHNRITDTGSVSIIRERLDPPVPPADPRFIASFNGSALTSIRIQFSLDPALEDDLEWSGLALYAEDRGLDGCGFYGDADDLALFAGLSALDLAGISPVRSSERDAEASEEEAELVDEVVRQELEGRWTVSGLSLLSVHDLVKWRELRPVDDALLELVPPSTAASEPPRQMIQLEAGLGLLPGSGTGRRYHLVRFRQLRRDERVEPRRTGWRAPTPLDRRNLRTTSAEAACAHIIAVVDSDGKELYKPVFQIENVPPDPGRRFLRNSQFAAITMPVDAAAADRENVPEPGTEPTAASTARTWSSPVVQLGIRHPLAKELPTLALGSGTDVPVGGFRIWVRDLLGSNHAVSFRSIATIQALPELVASYRTVPLDGSSPWRLDAAKNTTRVAIPDLATARQRLKEIAGELAKDKDLRVDLASVSERGRAGADVSAEAVFSRRFGEPGSGTTSRTLEIADPVFAGTLLSAMDELGLCLRVTLGIERMGRILAEGRRDMAGPRPLVRYVNDEVLEEYDASDVAFWVAEDNARHPFATLFVLPVLKLDGAQLPDKLNERIGAALAACSTATGPVALLSQLETDPMARAYGADRTCLYLWHGVQDGWRHELEWAVELLDRYDHLRCLCQPLEVAGDVEDRNLLLADAVEADARELLTLRRRAEVEDRVNISRDMRTARTRLVFRYDDPPERRAAAANALNATRFGELSIVHELSHELAGWEKYRDFLLSSELPGWLDPSPDVAGFVRNELQPRIPDRAAAADLQPGEERIDFGAVPPCFNYMLRSWLVADGKAGPAVEALGRVEPSRLSIPGNIRLVPDVNKARAASGDTAAVKAKYAVDVVFCMARLQHSHAPTGGLLGAAPVLSVGEYFGNEIELASARRMPLEMLPDLELAYHFFLALDGDDGEPELVPLLQLRGGAAASGDGVTVGPLRASVSAPWDSFVPESMDGAGMELKFEVQLLAEEVASRSPEILHRWLRMRDYLYARATSKGLPGYVELVRQNRTTGLMRIEAAS